MDYLIKNYYNKYETLKINCVRIIYIQNALKNNDLERSLVLANCFINMNTLNSGYGKELEYYINNNCPEMFKKRLEVPEYLMNIIKEKVNYKLN